MYWKRKNDSELFNIAYNLRLKKLNDVLSKEEEKILLNKIRTYNRIEDKHKLQNANLWLVLSIVKKYSKLNLNLDWLDLILEGVIGLLKTINKFKVDKGFKFSTYGYWWIKQWIVWMIADKNFIVWVPVHLFELKNKINKCINDYNTKFNKMPTIEYISKEVWSNIKKVKKLLSIKLKAVSLDNSISNSSFKSSHNLIDIIPSSKDTIYKNLCKKMIQDECNKLLNKFLKWWEVSIIKLWFGLKLSEEDDHQIDKKYLDGWPKTLQEISDIFKLTRERVRQLLLKSLHILKNNVDKNKMITIFRKVIH